MVNCSAIGCTNGSNTPSQESISFHKVPSSKKPLLRQKWLHDIRRKPPLPQDSSFYMCPVHFDETCFKCNLQVNNFIFPVMQEQNIFICNIFVISVFTKYFFFA